MRYKLSWRMGVEAVSNPAEFEKLLQRVIPKYEQVWGVKYNVSLSEQKSSTDTIAVNSDNTPYRV